MSVVYNLSDKIVCGFKNFLYHKSSLWECFRTPKELIDFDYSLYKLISRESCLRDCQSKIMRDVFDLIASDDEVDVIFLTEEIKLVNDYNDLLVSFHEQNITVTPSNICLHYQWLYKRIKTYFKKYYWMKSLDREKIHNELYVQTENAVISMENQSYTKFDEEYLVSKLGQFFAINKHRTPKDLEKFDKNLYKYLYTLWVKTITWRKNFELRKSYRIALQKKYSLEGCNEFRYQYYIWDKISAEFTAFFKNHKKRFRSPYDIKKFKASFYRKLCQLYKLENGSVDWLLIICSYLGEDEIKYFKIKWESSNFWKDVCFDKVEYFIVSKDVPSPEEELIIHDDRNAMYLAIAKLDNEKKEMIYRFLSWEEIDDDIFLSLVQEIRLLYLD